MPQESKHQAAPSQQPRKHAPAHEESAVQYAPRHALKPRALGTILRTLGLVFLALILTGTATAGTLYYKLQSNVTQHKIMLTSKEETKHQPPIDQKEGQPINILLLGSDARTPEEEAIQGVDGMRADTTMLMHISADRSRVDVVSIPRDTLVDIPACILPDGSQTWKQYDAMFNSAFMIGGATGDVGAAASCTLATVQNLTDLPIDGFVVVDFHSFQDVVNSIGGVEMCFNQPVVDTEANLDVPAGCQTLDGAQALGIARARHSIGDGSDISRISRQQELVFQIIKKLFSLNIFTNTQTFYQVASDVTSQLDTSEGLGNLTFLGGLAYSLRNLDTDKNLSFVTMPYYSDPNNPNRVRPAQNVELLWEALRNDAHIPSEVIMERTEQLEVVVGDHSPKDPHTTDSSSESLDGGTPNESVDMYSDNLNPDGSMS